MCTKTTERGFRTGTGDFPGSSNQRELLPAEITQHNCRLASKVKDA